MKIGRRPRPRAHEHAGARRHAQRPPTCHGGFIFALADSAFAFACNSYNKNTVASACSIDYVAPAARRRADRRAQQERTLAGRTGVYDITVSNQDGKAIALFRGKSYRIKGEVIAGLPAAQRARIKNTNTNRDRRPP
jgi:acyl-CoA thioesterase